MEDYTKELIGNCSSASDHKLLNIDTVEKESDEAAAAIRGCESVRKYSHTLGHVYRCLNLNQRWVMIDEKPAIVNKLLMVGDCWHYIYIELLMAPLLLAT